MDMADLLSWDKHELLRDLLVSSLAQEQQVGYAAVSLAQVRRADEAIFLALSKATATGVKKTNGKRPLDEQMQAAYKNLTSFEAVREPAPKASTKPGGKVMPTCEDFDIPIHEVMHPKWGLQKVFTDQHAWTWVTQ